MAQQEWEKLINPNMELLTYIKKGVLWIQKQPIYIVELLKEGNLAYVMVYKVHPGTEKDPKKLAAEQAQKRHNFSPNTFLGQLANRIIPNKVTKKWIPKPPVFVAPIVQNQMNTFTGQYEAGFFEREEDRMAVEGGEKKLIRGKNTGVFIGLSSIHWQDGFTIPTKSLVEALRHNENQGGFYDFSGNNQDKGNPLSTAYTNGGK
jgi:hypothetical protein